MQSHTVIVKLYMDLEIGHYGDEFFIILAGLVSVNVPKINK